jgi:uroporphyrinogen III methyltransferase/synthase
MSGIAYLVGAGPGDPELLTLKGARILAEADVIVYDRLANPRLLELAKPAAERIFAGKAANRHALPQEQLNALLVERVRAGQVVCRLKGGDPFVFGRGGEEALALAEAGLPWEYVPGIPSAVAAPGYAGIPVTHRGLGSALTIVTAHEDPLKGDPTLRWSDLGGGADTLVFLMGAERIPMILSRLATEGRSPDTPAAMISWGTWGRQVTVTGTLATLAERCREYLRHGGEPAGTAASLGALSPALTIVGPVVALRERLNWFEARPLFGRRIVITRPRDQAGALAEVLADLGGEPLFCPMIRTRTLPRPDLSPLDVGADWTVFTSANAVRALCDALWAAGSDVRRLGACRIAAIGPETARSLAEAGLQVDFVPTRGISEGLLEEFPELLSGRRVVIPRAREGREVLVEGLRAAGAEVVVLPVYETVPDAHGQSAFSAAAAMGRIDAITFASPSAIRAFVGHSERSLGRDSCIVCIGPVTAEAANKQGLTVRAVAAEPTPDAVAAAVVRAIGCPAAGVPAIWDEPGSG